MEQIIAITEKDYLIPIIKVINSAHLTVAKQFNFTKESNPTNNAFITVAMLKEQLESGIRLFAMKLDSSFVGCIAIEKSKRQTDTYYIEKVSVVPKYRKKGLGLELMKFALNKIKEHGGQVASIALIDEHEVLKKWYLNQGFEITDRKDFKHLPFRVCFMRMML